MCFVERTMSLAAENRITEIEYPIDYSSEVVGVYLLDFVASLSGDPYVVVDHQLRKSFIVNGDDLCRDGLGVLSSLVREAVRDDDEKRPLP